MALSQHQQWLHCPQEQAKIWKPRKNEIEYLNHKLNQDFRFSSPDAADDGKEEDERGTDSEQEHGREGEGEEAEEEAEEEEDLYVDDEKEQQQPHPKSPSPMSPPPQRLEYPHASQIAYPVAKPKTDNVNSADAVLYLDYTLHQIQEQRREEEEMESGAEGIESAEVKPRPYAWGESEEGEE